MDKDKGLNGFCDFIISKSSEQLYLAAPVVALVEAKNEKIVSGLGQCAAEMIAAKIYNEREGNAVSCIYGAVTTGHVWKFLKLENDTVYIDIEDYYIKKSEKNSRNFTFHAQIICSSVNCGKIFCLHGFIKTTKRIKSFVSVSDRH